MRKLGKTVALLAVLPALLMVPSMMVQSNAQQATGQAEILGTCGVSFPDGNVVDYGPLLPDTLSPEVTLNMTNSGSVNATLDIAAGNWIDTSSNDVMFANVTHYNTTAAQVYENNAGLGPFDQTVTDTFVPEETFQIFFQLLADLIDPLFTGSATQTMNFTVSC